MKTVALVFIALLLLKVQLSFSQQLAYESPAGTKYLLYTPPSYSTGTQTHPLLISLHSAGEVGDDLTKLTSTNNQMPCHLININKWPTDRPFIVLSPQLKPTANDPDSQWPAAYIDEVVRYVIAHYRVDLKRIYLTGISRGGSGTWTYAAAFPELIAAMVPLSGRTDTNFSGTTDTNKACRVKDIPTWIFHGETDLTVPTHFSPDMVNAINNCQPPGRFKPHLNILSAREHNGWNEVYNGTNGYPIFDWLLKFTKGSTVNTAPYVNAGLDRQIQLRSAPLTVIGDFFDTDGTITNVQWTQTSGTALTLSNTNSQFLKLTNLQAGTFEFELKVTDNNGAQRSDRVVIKILNTITQPVVTNLVLMNGKTNTDIGNLSEGQIINLAQLNLTEINVRAVATNTASVRFSVNTDQNTRTVNSVVPFLIRAQISAPEWQIGNGEYLICATPYSGGSASGTPGISQCFKVTVTDGVLVTTCQGVGQIERELWTGITGTSVSGIPVNTQPTSKSILTSFEGPTNVGDNYGTRIRGYVCPPSSGNYIFWIASNENSELWLSTDEDPNHKVKIASVSGYTGVRQWTKFTSQQSASINLQAGRKYYIEALQKEGIGSDNLSVGWQLPNAVLERPIPGNRLIPYQTSCSSTGKIKRELWTGITGTSVSLIPVSTPPSSASELTNFEGPTNSGANYGARVRGHICAPSTGNYVFWIASNDNSELWLSTNDSPANKLKIASVAQYTGYRQWDKFTTQRSQNIPLIAGQRYYVEVLHKQGEGSDNFAVGWQLPDGTLERPIQGNRLSPFTGTSSAGFAAQGVDENVLDQEISDLTLSPNPLNKSEFTIHLSGLQQTSEESHAFVEITSMTGSNVFSERIDCQQCNEIEIHLNRNLTPGIYLFHVVIDGKRFMKRLVVL